MLAELYQELLDYLIVFLEYLPTLITGLGVFLAGWLTALLVRKIVRMLVRMAGVDVAIYRVWYGKLSEQERRTREKSWSPSLLIAQGIYWLIIITTLMLAANVLGLTAAANLLESFISFIPEILIAIIILSLGTFIARRAARLSENFAISLGVKYGREIGLVVKFFIIFITLLSVFDYLNFFSFISLAGFTIIAGAITVSLFIILLFCGRRIIASYLSHHSLKTYLRRGMLIEFEDISGRVREIRNFVTVIDSGEDTIYYPNQLLLEKNIRQLKYEREEDKTK